MQLNIERCQMRELETHEGEAVAGAGVPFLLGVLAAELIYADEIQDGIEGFLDGFSDGMNDQPYSP